MSIEEKIKENEKLITLGGAKIITHYNKILIPEGSTLLRTRRHKVTFYTGPQPEGNTNGWSDIPESAKKVFFPEYRIKSGTYGLPEFKYD